MTMVRSVLSPAEPSVWRKEKDLGRIWQTQGGWTLLGFLAGAGVGVRCGGDGVRGHSSEGRDFSR